MIQEIAPFKFDPVYYAGRRPGPDDFLLYYEGNNCLLLKEGDALKIPTFRDFTQGQAYSQEAYYLFSVDERSYYLVSEVSLPDSGGFCLENTRVFREFTPAYQGFCGITGSQIDHWRKNRAFCGRCGSPTKDSDTERAKVCPVCGQIEYPKICPAVIVAVTNGDKLLLTRYAKGRSTYRRYALVAGYVEVGESLEECVRREVLEEVGLKLKNIRYYKSQPWAFSDTEMVGFTAQLDGDETIRLERAELSEAGWFARDEIETYESTASVGQEMIMAFKAGTL